MKGRYCFCFLKFIATRIINEQKGGHPQHSLVEDRFLIHLIQKIIYKTYLAYTVLRNDFIMKLTMKTRIIDPIRAGKI